MSTRILVVDDDTTLAEMIGIMLESEGHTPSFCADDAKAMDRRQLNDVAMTCQRFPSRRGR